MKKPLLLLSICFLSFKAVSQQAQQNTPEFETDRPTATESSRVVPIGLYQVETGFKYQKQKQAGIEKKEWLYPQALVRMGALEWAEIRVEATFRRETYREGDALLQMQEGLSMVRVGTKVNLLTPQGARPEISVLAMLELPWGEDAFEPEQVAPELMLLFSNDLSEKINLQYNAGFQREQEEGEMENKLQFSAALSGKVSEKIILGAEFFGEKAQGSAVQNQIDASIQFLLLPNVQLDAIVGTGVSSQAPDFFAGGGVSFRLPR
ncbi:transporter [Rufibacter glacialis]|nr:transporter [Rufibacter glacialis]